MAEAPAEGAGVTLPAGKGLGYAASSPSPSRNLYYLTVRKTSQAPNIHLGRSLYGLAADPGRASQFQLVSDRERS